MNETEQKTKSHEPSKVMVKDKDIAVPGETLAIGMDTLPGQGT